jgi:hypothetical protein
MALRAGSCAGIHRADDRLPLVADRRIRFRGFARVLIVERDIRYIIFRDQQPMVLLASSREAQTGRSEMEGVGVLEGISGLDDRSAEGIVRAVDDGVIPNDTPYSRIIADARTLVGEGRGGWQYIGSLGETPQWEPPTGEIAVEPPDDGPDENPPAA